MESESALRSAACVRAGRRHGELATRVHVGGITCAARSAAERDVMNAVAEVVNIASVSRSLEVCMLEACLCGWRGERREGGRIGESSVSKRRHAAGRLTWRARP